MLPNLEVTGASAATQPLTGKSDAWGERHLYFHFGFMASAITAKSPFEMLM